MPRWLGIDSGTRRVGVAAGSTEDGIASPVTTLAAQPSERLVEHILQLTRDYQAVGVVVGLPLNMDGTEGEQARAARRLARQIADAAELDVRLWDERLSSFAADAALAGKLTRKKRRARQDAIAAAEILREFLDSNGPETAPRPQT
ncbi:MAG: Holliday junction resolvase RuvX [Phycisphaerae bacterium]